MRASKARCCAAGVRDSVAISESTSGLRGVATLPRWRAVPRARARANSRSTWRLMASPTASISRAMSSCPRSRRRAASALSAASGVFNPCARSAARLRERSISRSCASIRPFTSSTSGFTSTGTFAGRCRRCPERISAIPRRKASSGRKPSATWIEVAIASTRPSSASAMARSRANFEAATDTRARSVATVTRTGTRWPLIVSNTRRSLTKSRALAGPGIM